MNRWERLGLLALGVLVLAITTLVVAFSRGHDGDGSCRPVTLDQALTSAPTWVEADTALVTSTSSTGASLELLNARSLTNPSDVPERLHGATGHLGDAIRAQRPTSLILEVGDDGRVVRGALVRANGDVSLVGACGEEALDDEVRALATASHRTMADVVRDRVTPTGPP